MTRVRARDVVFGRRPARTLVRIVILIAASTVVFGWVLIPVRTYGDSMRPTYTSGSFSLVNRAAYLRREPHRGDIVAVRLAGLHVVYVKRIVGLPGERVAIRTGEVSVNGSRLNEPYVAERGTWSIPEFPIPAGEYLVIGDNRLMPMQAHEFGLVRRERIAGPLLW